MFNTTVVLNITNIDEIAIDEANLISEIMLIILMGSFLVCASCGACYICYVENKHMTRWKNWVNAKKKGYPTIIV